MTIASALKLIERERQSYRANAKDMRDIWPEGERAESLAQAYDEAEIVLARIAVEIKRPARKKAAKGKKR